MAVVTSISKLSYADNSHVIAKGQHEYSSHDGVTPPLEINMRKGENGTRSDGSVIESCVPIRKNKASSSRAVNRKFYHVMNAFHSTEKHLKFLDSYLGKLHGDAKKPSMKNFHQREVESIGNSDQHKLDNILHSLKNYLDKVKSDAEPEQLVDKDLLASENAAKSDLESGRGGSLKNYMELKSEDEERKHKSEDRVTDFYIIGFFHISLGSWVLFTFGLQVSQEYGSFTVALIYFLGGITGNLISYLHTPEPTVGGMGPVFAIIGAWLIYRTQSKDVIPREATDKMFENAIIVTALSFVLSDFSPTDNWAHFAAAFIGIAYGFLTCPTLRVKDVPTETSQQKGMMLVKHYANPCKSLVYFSIFLLLLSSLLLVLEPPLDLTEVRQLG